MNIATSSAAATAATIPLAAHSADQSSRAAAILRAATLLLPLLEGGRQISTSALGAAMSSCFGGTDAEGFWIWKDAYEALEAAQVLFIRKFGPAILSRSASPQAALALMSRIAQLVPTHTRQLMTAKIEGAIAAGNYDKGLETITAESVVVTDRRTVYTHPVSGGQSHVLTVARKDRIQPLGLIDALAIAGAEPQSILLVNSRSSALGFTILATLLDRHSLVGVDDRTAAA